MEREPNFPSLLEPVKRGAITINTNVSDHIVKSWWFNHSRWAVVVLGGCGIQAGENEDAAFTVRLMWGDIGPGEDSAMGR